MQQFFPLSGEASTLANAVATTLCTQLTIEEQNIWGNLFALIGASMLSIAAINQTISTSTQNSTQTNDTNAVIG